MKTFRILSLKEAIELTENRYWKQVFCITKDSAHTVDQADLMSQTYYKDDHSGFEVEANSMLDLCGTMYTRHLIINIDALKMNKLLGYKEKYERYSKAVRNA